MVFSIALNSIGIVKIRYLINKWDSSSIYSEAHCDIFTKAKR